MLSGFQLCAKSGLAVADNIIMKSCFSCDAHGNEKAKGLAPIVQTMVGACRNTLVASTCSLFMPGGSLRTFVCPVLLIVRAFVCPVLLKVFTVSREGGSPNPFIQEGVDPLFGIAKLLFPPMSSVTLVGLLRKQVLFEKQPLFLGARFEGGFGTEGAEGQTMVFECSSGPVAQIRVS